MIDPMPEIKKITHWIEKFIIHVLIVMMAIVLVLATLELGYQLMQSIF
jgi:hypothetical protein